MKANAAQETDAWLHARAGAFTASRAADLMAKTRSGPAASRANLLTLLAVERITGQCVETYQNAAMARGQELEAEARDAYMFATGNVVEECGYITHPKIDHVGASPDGTLGADGLLEIKCPASMQKHLEALLRGAHAVEYRWQLQHQMMVTGRAWVDAVSYDPRFPEKLQLAIARVPRDTAAIKALLAEIERAEIEVQEIVNQLEAKAA